MTKKQKLPLGEQETIINFNREDAWAEIFTYEPAWQRKLEKMGVLPYQINNFGGMMYRVPKRFIRPPSLGKKKLSEEAKKTLAKRLEKARRPKQ